MEDNLKAEAKVKEEVEVRREFLKKVGKSSAAVPAAALLLAASTEKASAGPAGPSGGSGSSVPI